ncbi:PARP6, partial [Symbiodinium sp. KB8]
DPPRKKGRAWWERPPPEYHWKDGEWKKKNTRGVRSLQKQAERIERGQKRRLENPHREREEPPAPEAPAAPPEEESSEESLDTGAPPVVLQEAPVPQNRADEESGESSSESSSSSSSEEEPEPLPSNPAVSQQAERIRAVRLESSESEGKPNGPFSPPRVPEPRTPEQPSVPEPRTPPQATASGDPSVETKPEPTELEEAARAADGAFVVVKEKPDYSEDEPLPQADPPAAASWVFVRDLLDEAAADPEAPASPAQAPEERVDPPKRVEPPKREAPPIPPLTEAAVGRQLAELTAALQRAEASHREMRMGQAGGTAAPAGGTASSAAPPAVADDWERFVWQLETYAALVDSSFPGHLEEARRESDEADEAVESEECRQLSVKLFSMLEWESDLAKYEAEFGVEKAISDEDKRALLMVESPGALKQHLAMTAGKLTKYEDVRGLVVSYLQAKRVWTPSGAYAQPAGRRHHDPDAMDIGKVGDAKGKDPKGHTVKECWYNSKGKGKGAQQKGGVHAVSDDTASPDTFLEPVNTAARQTLYSVDDTPLDTKGTVEPVLKLGRRSRQEAKTSFQVVSGITDDILSVNRAVDAGARVVFDAAGSYIEWEDGSRADFIRSGRQFLMPYTCAGRPRKRTRVAAVGEEEHYPDDPEAQAVADFARAEAAAEEERRELAEAWCPECVQGAGAQQRQAPEDESILVTVLTLVDRNFVLDTVEQYLNTLGHSRVTLQIDSEGSLRSVVKTTDKMTPYKIVNGVEYLSSICRFGETVMAKLPKPGTKAQRRWIRGLWVGKLDRDNTNIILTECGALSVRSVRRLPAEAQANRTLMGSAAGVPWALRQGRVLREPPPMVAQPVVLPAPTVEAAAAEERDEYRELEGPAQLPTMAHEGETRRVDQEAQDVEAAAVLEDLVPLEDIEVFPQAGGIGDLASELGAKREGAGNSEEAFTPVHKRDKPTAAQTFHYKWVDKVKEGVAKSRFTCADVKRAYTAEQEQDLRVFVPTPTPEAHALLEITALQKGCAMRTFDIVAAFLIGQDRGAQEEKWVYMRPPPEWRPIWEEWVREQPPADQARLWGQFNEMLFRLDGNLYGRRTAGSVYRDELEEVLCVKLKETGRYDFKRGVKDPCVYRCLKTGIVVVHHIDDGDAASLNKLLDEDLAAHCEITTGPLEAEGVSGEVLGKTKTRLPGCILTAPDPKHAENIIKALGLKPGEKSPVPSRKPDLSDTTLLEAGDAARYRSAVGDAT